MDCVYRDRCKKYSLGKCEFSGNGRAVENCSDYKVLDHSERGEWNWFEMLTPLEFKERE
jgi:hypothetical protein